MEKYNFDNIAKQSTNNYIPDNLGGDLILPQYDPTQAQPKKLSYLEQQGSGFVDGIKDFVSANIQTLGGTLGGLTDFFLEDIRLAGKNPDELTEEELEKVKSANKAAFGGDQEGPANPFTDNASILYRLMKAGQLADIIPASFDMPEFKRRLAPDLYENVQETVVTKKGRGRRPDTEIVTREGVGEYIGGGVQAAPAVAVQTVLPFTKLFTRKISSQPLP